MKEISFPLAVSELGEFVPHRPPMLWIDEVTRVAPGDGECLVRIKSGSYYLDDRGAIRTSSFIEWIAQAFAFVQAAEALSAGIRLEESVKEAFLVGVRGARLEIPLDDPELWGSKSVSIRVSNYRFFGPIMIIDGEVRLESGRLAMKANLKVFQITPPAIATPS